MLSRFWERGGAWVVAQVFVLAITLAGPFYIPASLAPWPESLSTARLVASSAFLLGGLILAVGGALRLGRNLTPLPKPLERGMLTTTGLYRFVRHPIYGGLVLLVVGCAFKSPSMLALPLILVAFVFFDRKASREERWLLERYSTYAEYRRGTKKLFPLLY